MFLTAMTPTPLSVLVQECVELAITDCGYRMKSAAIDMGVTLSLLSEGLSGEKHLSLQRLSNLGNAFLVKFCKRVMARLGGVAFDAEETRLLMGAASLGPKRMARMTLATPIDHQKASAL